MHVHIISRFIWGKNTNRENFYFVLFNFMMFLFTLKLWIWISREASEIEIQLQCNFYGVFMFEREIKSCKWVFGLSGAGKNWWEERTVWSECLWGQGRRVIILNFFESFQLFFYFFNLFSLFSTYFNFFFHFFRLILSFSDLI